MSPERWQQIESLYYDALERPAPERAAWLAQACAGDEALRGEVEQLLAADESASGFLDAPAWQAEARKLAAEIPPESPTESLAGQQISRYRLLSRLGAGGMGEVWLAHDPTLQRKVAVKLLPPEFSADRDRVLRFEQEARAASALNHPHIITVHEVGQAEGVYYLVTEHIEGQTLRERLVPGALPVSVALDLIAQVAGALAAAHEAGIVHRDIKPENVMVRPDGLVKVLDFGLAKVLKTPAVQVDTEAPTQQMVKTQSGFILGTLNYLSPEQARGKDVDARTDIFSLGILLYELVTAKRPFTGETTSDLIAAILKTEPPPLAANAPKALQDIINRALQKEQGARYPTAQAMLDDLKRLKHRLDYEAEWGETATLISAGAVAATDARADARTDETQVLRTTTLSGQLLQQVGHHRWAAAALFAALLALSGWGVYEFAFAQRKINSIAILPLVNKSGDANNDYLPDGLTEGLINSLSQLNNLRVMARSTVFRYKGKEDDPVKAGHELGVRAVLSGRVELRGAALTVNAELVNVADGSVLWTGEYEQRSLADLQTIKRDIARGLAAKLQLPLNDAEQGQLAKQETDNTEAYRLYLKGRYYWNKRTADGLQLAIKEFQQAVDKDPTYALAYVGLADSYALLEEYAGTTEPDTYAKAKAYAERALALDDKSAEAHASLANINHRLWNFAEAEQGFKRALDLNPRYATARHWYSAHLRNLRRYDEALREIKLARELDPLSLAISEVVASNYVLLGNFAAAEEESRKAIKLEPNFPGARRVLGRAFLKQGRGTEAIAEIQQAVALSKRNSRSLSLLGYAYAVTGQRAQALELVKELEERYARRETNGVNLAGVYAGLGDKDQVFAWLEKDFQAHAGLLVYVNWELNFEALRNDARLTDLLRRMRVPQ